MRNKNRRFYFPKIIASPAPGAVEESRRIAEFASQAASSTTNRSAEIENRGAILSTYPVVKQPQRIEAVSREFPPEPSPPTFPAQPPTLLKPEPQQPAIPAKPQRPGEFKQPIPKKVPVKALAIAEGSSAIISPIVGALANSPSVGLQFFVALTLFVGFFGGWQYFNYPQRLQNYREAQKKHQQQVKNFPKILQQWQNEKQQILSSHQNNLRRFQLENEQLKQQHQQQIKNWEQDKDRLEREYQRQLKELKNPLTVEQWRKEEFKQRLKSLNPRYLGHQSEDFRGFTEYPNNCSFGSKLSQYWGNKINILRCVGNYNYVPDFAYVDEANCLFIDIEIDEPYTPRQYPNSDKDLKLIHCIGDDDYRDSQFTQSDWIVIHFSENQVCRYPDRCCKFIAQLIFDLTGDNSALSKMSRINNLEIEPRWTATEATQMAQQRSRVSCGCK